jgi:2-methylcitrate dehydratase PrpD
MTQAKVKESPMSDNSTTASQRIADAIGRITFDEIPRSAIEKTKDHLAHLLAATFAGLEEPVGRRGRDVAERLGSPGLCTVVGVDRRACAADATFANASMMSAGGLDDFLLPAGVHPGLVTVPAALAVAEQERRSGRDLLVAVVTGYEVLGALGGLVWCWEQRTPQRATIPFGAFGPTAASAVLLRLSPAELSNAIGYAANAAMGLSENPFFEHYYALVARHAVTVTAVAAAGGRTPPSVMEGRSGFFQSLFGMIPSELDDAIDGIGHRMHIEQAELKYRATTGMNTAAIELMRSLGAEESIRADQVDSITLHLSARRENHVIGHATGPFTAPWQATSSAAFNVAVALVDGDVVNARYNDYADPVLASLVARTRVRLVDTEHLQYARLEITTDDGRTLARELHHFRQPERPRHASLRRHGEGILSPSSLDQLASAIDDLDALDDVSELTRLLRPSGG